MEYFCFEGDGLWSMPDDELIALAKNELQIVGFGSMDDYVDGCVIRQAKAYPVYDDEYRHHVEVVRQTLAAQCPNLHLVGRNGMHKYNNQDHAMMTALLAARNILAGERLYDVWAVNQDGEYHEAGQAGAEDLSGRSVPSRMELAPRKPARHLQYRNHDRNTGTATDES